MSKSQIKVAFFTENCFEGKVPRDHINMRTEFAWMVALQADHYTLGTIPKQKYDLGIIIPSKSKPELVQPHTIRDSCYNIAIMQEGPFWYFQDYEVSEQVNYYNNLVASDIILCHNESDKKYFEGMMSNKTIKVLPSLMIEDPIKKIFPKEERSGIMIGGNLVSWYGGFDSWRISKFFTEEIYAPSMGRSQKQEEALGINKLPYLLWSAFITELSKRKIGVHLMRTHAAGTFALNCSFLGIPCIGYKGLDTQRILHPHLSVDDGDLISARKKLDKLWNDVDFYDECANITLKNYKKYYSEEVFKKTWKI